MDSNDSNDSKQNDSEEERVELICVHERLPQTFMAPDVLYVEDPNDPALDEDPEPRGD